MMRHRNGILSCSWCMTINKIYIQRVTRHGVKFLVRASIKGAEGKLLLYPVFKRDGVFWCGRQWQIAWEWMTWDMGKAATWGSSVRSCWCAVSNDIGFVHGRCAC